MLSARLPPSETGLGQAARAVARNLGWLLASRGLLAILSLFYLGIAARTLGVYGFGRFALITGAAQALSTLVAFQSWTVVVQYGVGLVRSQDEEGLGRLFKGAALLDLISAVVGAVVAIVILELWSEDLGIGPTLKRATLIYAVVQVVTIRSTPLGILRLRDRFSVTALADGVTAVTRFVGAILVALIHPTVQGFMLVWGLGEVLTSAAYWFAVTRSGDLDLLMSGKGVRQLPHEHPGIWRFALSTNANTTLAQGSKQVPLLAVGAVLGPAAAGVFRLAAQLAQALAKFSQLVSRAAFSEVVRAVRGAERARVRRLLGRAMGVSLAGGALIMGVVALFGEAVLRLVAGHPVPGAFPVLLLMAAAGCSEFTGVVFDTVMTARDEAGLVFLIRLLGLAVIAMIAAAVMPIFGAAGMAAAVFAGSLVSVALMGAVSWWRLRPSLG